MGSYMPLSWATDGSRLEIPLLVEFLPGGELVVHRAGEFLGEWTEPPDSVFGPQQLVSGLLDSMPGSPATRVPPSISGGQWRMSEEEGGRLVLFNIRTSGFRRGSIWLPERKVHFRAKVYGQNLVGGKDATATIREDLYAFGATIGAVLIFILGPLCMLSLIFFVIGRVNIVVGNWSCTRFEGDVGAAVLPPATLKGDTPSKWQ